MKHNITGLLLLLMGAVGGASMSRNLKSMALCLLLFSSFTVQASSTPVALTCTVKTFTETGAADAEFVNSNLRKKFVISIEEKEVLVTSICDTCASGIRRYTIVGNNGLGSIVAIGDISLTLDTIVIDPVTARATIANQMSSFVNAWELDCKKQ